MKLIEGLGTYDRKLPPRFERSPRKPVALLFQQDRDSLAKVSKSLIRGGYVIRTAVGEKDAEEMLKGLRPDIAVMDQVGFRHPGVPWMREGIAPPLVVVDDLSESTPDEVVTYLERGADDVIDSSSHPDYFSARLDSILLQRAVARDRGPIVKVGDVEINLDRCTIKMPGQVVTPVPREWWVMAQLAINQGRIMSTAELSLKGLQIQNEYEDPGLITTDIHLLRKSLGSYRNYITNYPDFGYRLAVPESSKSSK